MGRLGKTPSNSAAELEQPDHLPHPPPPTTASEVVTSSDPPPGNNASDCVIPIEVPPELNNQEQLPSPPLQHPEEKDRASEIVEVVEFPPRSSVSIEARLPLDPDKQMVVYVPPPGDNMIPPTGGRPLNGKEEVVMFPPQNPAYHVHVQPNVIPGENVPNAVYAGNQQPSRNKEAGKMPPVILVPFIGAPWHSGLFDCCQQPANAIITMIAPCVTFGQIVEILDNGSTSCLTGTFLYIFLFLVLCHWNIGVSYRRRMRTAYQIAETPVSDRIAHVMFPCCALCQEFRELQYRGLDPFLGYKGVIAGILHGQNQPTVPPPNQSMTRG